MKNRFICILLAISVISSTLATGILAVPTIADISDSEYGNVFLPEDDGIISDTADESVSENAGADIPDEVTQESRGPSIAAVTDTACVDGSYFNEPEMFETASLMSELVGEGTKESPYLISTADELKTVAANVNSGIATSAYYKLTNNIDLGGDEWTPIGTFTESQKYSVSFSGVFDGAGYTVSNFRISQYKTTYLGFFGLISGGEIKNLNIENAHISIDTEKTFAIYAGILAGRIIADTPLECIEISHCNVTDSSVTITNTGTIYAGGAIGSAFTNVANSNILISFVSANCDVSATSLAQDLHYNKETGKYERHYTLAAGLISSINTKADSVIAVTNCSADGSTKSSAIDSMFTQAMGGGLFANVRTYDDSTRTDGRIVIRESFSHGTVYGDSNVYPYILGGLSGQFYSAKNIFVYDCYSTNDISGKYLSAGKTGYEDPSAGGFVGQAMFMTTNNIVSGCYAEGDVIDLTHTESTPKDTSFVGGFAGWIMSRTMKNCYRLESQTVVGSDVDSTDTGNVTALSAEDSLIAQNYAGFDFDRTWKPDTSGEFAYPVLREKQDAVKFFSGDLLFDVITFDESARIAKSPLTPAKAQTIEHVFAFTHWSETQDGEAFDFDNTSVTEDTVLYALFSAVPRSYSIKYISNNKTFLTQKLAYGSVVTPPEAIPQKPDAGIYYYNFLHWSDKADGSAYDFTDCTVTGNMTFYAVYEEIDKSAWTGDVAEEFDSGFGTETLPYIIKTSDQFALMAKLVNEQAEGYVNAYYALGNNINLGKKEWVPIGSSKEKPFSGHFDGRGFSISNFQIAESKYAGLFGYILNGTVKNLGISDFTIEIAPSSALEDDCFYIGALAGYISSASYGKSTISGIGITNGSINVNASVSQLYTGLITGYADSNQRSKTLIYDCFADGNVNVINTRTAGNAESYSYAGGLAGLLYTGSSSLTQLFRSYHKGNVASQSYNSSRAGGLVGYLHSLGSGWTASEQAEIAKDEDTSYTLAADSTYDIMIKDSFAVSVVTSLSTNKTSYAGRIIGSRNSECAIDNVVYAKGVSSADALSSTSTLKTEVNSEGYMSEVSNLKSAEILSNNRGFDFENVWTFSKDYEYPVLMCILANKPVLELVSSCFEDGRLDATIKVMANNEDYTVIIGVYNARNQLIRTQRIRLSFNGSEEEFSVSYDGIENAESFVITAYETKTMIPIFTGLRLSIYDI